MARVSLHKKYLDRVKEYNTCVFEGTPDSMRETDKIKKMAKLSEAVDKAWHEFLADAGFDGRVE